MNVQSMNNDQLDAIAIRRDRYGPGMPFETLDELARDTVITPKPWIMKGIIARGETSAWVAPPGGLKSALMAELAICTAWGDDWHGFKHKSIWNVVYFALERADLVRRRLRAHVGEWSKANGGRLPEDMPSITVVPGTLDLMDPASVNKVLQTIKNSEYVMGHVTGLVIFDTFAKLIAAGGGDEDKAKDQGRVFTNIQRIKDALGKIGAAPHVALVGHTGKDVERGARGSNALYGDVDMLVTIAGDDVKTATVVKANDMAEGPVFSFKSRLFEFGTDDDGDPITVNIVEPAEQSSQVATKAKDRLTANERTMFGILHDAGAIGLSTEDWNEKARALDIGTKRKATLHDIKQALKGKGMIRQLGERWTVNHD
ncbi:AAA family ATPase [Tardiphaga sp. 709]|uniref:AAA family ATPase n=1 Tax=Tardiphaga sp. 709 TaxID=3076039 RepID=UPI0028EF508C|nr:AAA family ATPase [Tardiphaga sp. 709]WNV10178.1 AAA family ATPase [Tardiphaga sp. 709]